MIASPFGEFFRGSDATTRDAKHCKTDPRFERPVADPTYHSARLPLSEHHRFVRHQVSRTYEGKFDKEGTSAEHRAGWDAAFSAPKSVSLTALVGGDDRVREAHRESVRAALR